MSPNWFEVPPVCARGDNVASTIIIHQINARMIVNTVVFFI